MVFVIASRFGFSVLRLGHELVCFLSCCVNTYRVIYVIVFGKGKPD